MFDIEKSIGFVLAKAHRQVHAELSEELEQWGITPTQFFLMAFLWQKDGLSQIELSQKTRIDRTTISGVIDRLENANLLTRQPCPEDRRTCLIVLTDKGRNLEDDLCRAASHVNERISARITPEGKVRLQEMLSTLVD